MEVEVSRYGKNIDWGFCSQTQISAKLFKNEFSQI